MHIKRTYNFLIDKEKDKPDGKLRFRVKWNANRSIVAFGVGYRVNPAKWSAETSRCVNNSTHGVKKVMANVINAQIANYTQIADNVFQSFEIQNIVPSVDDFRNSFNTAIGKTKAVQPTATVFDVLDMFTTQVGRANSWTRSTHQKFEAVRNKLQGFKDNLSFDDFNTAGLNDYIAYLRDVYKLRNVTIGKQIGFLKWFLKWATLNGYNNNRDYEAFQPKLKRADKKVIFLTWDELMSVYAWEFDLNKKYIERVRDVFCFCCFTSLRYSDVANLRRSDVKDNHIEVTTVKTSDTLRIELNNYSRAILQKYSTETFPNNLALPVISNQRMNDYLKEMGEICQLNEPIRQTYYSGNQRTDEVKPKYALLGTHAGRRTFICNALMLGIPADVVMKWTGHSDYAAMKPYIDIADKAKADAMSLFNR